MCGRYALTLPPEAMRRLFAYDERPNFPPRHNIAPTQPIAVITADADGRRHFRLARWGLIPAWAKDPGAVPLLINARAETAADKPAFRGAMRHRRCLIPADGFYEWQRTGRDKRPFLFRRPDGTPFAFAGLLESWLGADGSEIDTAAILTTAANPLMALIHDRMPVLIEDADRTRWLDCTRERPQDVADCLVPAPVDHLEAVPVSQRVNSVREDDPGLMAPLAEPLRAP